ncbi:MAG: tetrahydromethanopterin biosynthesis protein [Gemmatimonadetes bacterium]|nr:tetrahydromethanopterin biosynthesis protein [Gemmatimonadota bacterium]
MTDGVIGWDLGGAHLKAARLAPDGGVAAVVQLACPLWQGLAHLEAAMREAVRQLGPAPVHALTMTGEMVDLFATREEGVARILDTAEAQLAGSVLRVYAGAGGFVPGTEARRRARQVASANWRATAALIARRLPWAFLVDIGSTTADLIPIGDGRVRALGATDFDRLVLGELVYAGIARTPVMAIAPAVTFEGLRVPLVAEYFATSADVYRLTGELPEGADLHPAADQGEKTVAASARRLARMVGRDAASAPLDHWRELAHALRDAQLAMLLEAFDRQWSRGRGGPEAPLVAAGAGRFLVEEMARRRDRQVRTFAGLFPPGAAPAARINDCAPAVAVAALGAAP